MQRLYLVFMLSISFGLNSVHADIDYPDFSSMEELNLIGDIIVQNNHLIITPSTGCNAGAVWFINKQLVQNGFETIFQFQLTGLGGIADSTGQNGGDGFAFVIQNHSSSSLGSAGGYIGYTGIANSVAIEFDTFNNHDDLGDPINNSNHISIHTRGIEPNSANHDYSLGCVTDIPNMSDGSVFTVKIKYASSAIELFLNDVPVINVPLNLDATLDLDNGFAWVGFTGGICSAYEKHIILNWSFYEHADADEDGVYDYEDNCLNHYNPNQEDTYPPLGNDIGDACDCEADFNCDGNVDANDVSTFLADFGRNQYNIPCSSGNPCNGNFNCDTNVDAADVTKFLEDFGRNQYNNPCPACEVGEWCEY